MENFSRLRKTSKFSASQWGLPSHPHSRENPAHTNTQDMQANRLTHTNRYMLTPPVMYIATCITLNESLADTNTYFTEVHNVFAFQKLLSLLSRFR